MAKDFVWLQFMLFCHRNGLYYGDAPDDVSVLQWDESKSVVRYPPKASAGSKTLHDITNGENGKSHGLAPIITVGTLERALRQ
jgi:hypothetical protein